MMQREDGPIPEEYTLWKSSEEDGVKWYVSRNRLCMIPAEIADSHRHILTKGRCEFVL